MALILIVDDSPTEVHVMKKALEKSGYQTATADDGAEAQNPSPPVSRSSANYAPKLATRPRWPSA